MRNRGLLKEDPVICRWDTCEMIFANSRIALNHLRQEHDLRASNGKCKWKNCKFETSALNIRNHVKKHFSVVEAICELCPQTKTFKWRFDLSKHIRHAHQGDEFEVEKQNIDGFDVFIARSNVAKEMPHFLNKIMN